MRIRTTSSNALHDRHSRFWVLMVACALAIGVWSSSKPERAEAQDTTPVAVGSPEFSSGMVGIAPGLTLRLNVVNIGGPTAAPLPCVLLLAFLDTDGKVLEQKFVSLQSGKAAFLDLEMRNVHGPDRAQVRGIGYNPLLTAESVPQPVSCSLVPTLELFDSETGRTTAIVTDFVTALR
jgi:hypothetical protein